MPIPSENWYRQRYQSLVSVFSQLPRPSRRSLAILGAAALVVLISFLIGSQHGQRHAAKFGPGARKILYYVDPMNPAHTSPEPGLAPCGMKMEPVYADEVGQYPDAPLAPGTVRVTNRKQQLIGMRLATVEKAPYSYTFRALGRVAVDERLIYRLVSAVDGWIREVGNNSTGSVVKKGETLAIFYSPVFLAAQQAYIYALSSLDHYKPTAGETPAQIQLNFRTGIQQNLDSLRNLGMSDEQVKEIEKTRQYNENVRIVAPDTSFVLARNISVGQRFEKGAEWYRLADLSRVWVLADLYENEASLIRPGERVFVRHPYTKKTVQGVVSDVLPQFDSTSRTLKVRLEVENPDFELRPDMFMDVDFQVALSETVSIPTDAILDSGLRKTVFVDRGEGFFEPRNVTTGWRLGDRVQILKGLEPGEKIVVSGNFLIDSESRMKMAAAGLVGDIGTDVVCSKLVDERKAGAEGGSSQYRGKSYFFCSESCKQKFDQDPDQYIGSVLAHPPTGSSPAACSTPASIQPEAQEPVVAAPPPGWQPPVFPPVQPLVGSTVPHKPSGPQPPAPSPATTPLNPTAPDKKHPVTGSGPECHDNAGPHPALPAAPPPTGHQQSLTAIPPAQPPVGSTLPPKPYVAPQPPGQSPAATPLKPTTPVEKQQQSHVGPPPLPPGIAVNPGNNHHQAEPGAGGEPCHD